MTKKKGGNKEYNNGSIKCELDALQKNVVRNFLPHHLISGLFGQAGSAKDFIKVGIIDPVKVTRVALENASSVARTLLSSNVIIK